MAEQNKSNQAANADAATDAGTDEAVQQALADAQSSISDLQQQVDGARDTFATGDATAAAGFAAGADAEDAATRIDLLGDVDLEVSIELGRTEMLVEDVLKLGTGSVVELNKLAGDPVDVYVNGRLVARGEVLVLNDNFCIRISEIVANLQEQAEEAVAEQQEASTVS